MQSLIVVTNCTHIESKNDFFSHHSDRLTVESSTSHSSHSLDSSLERGKNSYFLYREGTKTSNRKAERNLQFNMAILVIHISSMLQAAHFEILFSFVVSHN